MEKEVRRFETNYSLDWQYGVEISKLKADLEELEELGATHVEIDPYTEYDSTYVKIEAYCERIETDEEFEQRKKQVEATQEQMRQRDLKQLADLKSKYGL
jgi:2-methylisocitrate lyase-like PEP mutase family enzyme